MRKRNGTHKARGTQRHCIANREALHRPKEKVVKVLAGIHYLYHVAVVDTQSVARVGY